MKDQNPVASGGTTLRPSDFLRVLSRDYLLTHRVLPLRRENGAVSVLTANGDNPDIADDMRVAFKVPEVRWVTASEDEVDEALERALVERSETVMELVEQLPVVDARPLSDDTATAEDLTSLANQPPVVKLVNLVLLEALDARASDVHLERQQDGLRVRYRIDGILTDGPSPPAHMRDAVISRIKVMAGMDIAERRAPQDGRVRLRLRDREIDVRVSTLPAIHGESVVLRLLDPNTQRLELEELGMDPGLLEAFDRLVRRPHGIVLVSGPTGSGKTTTLYAALERIKTGAEKIVTVEDPVEYRIPGVVQVQVNRAAGVTFSSALRSILRQDPDVILVGEMRDPETAEMAVHAALTGHRVFSTVHTNDAATGVTRLLDLGVPDYLVASAVQGILAQRLVRRICADCREPIADTGPRSVAQHSFRGRGCDRCRDTGYRGRIGIFELLVLDEELRSHVMEHKGGEALAGAARERGMRTLREDGLEKATAGLTTLEEAERVTEES